MAALCRLAGRCRPANYTGSWINRSIVASKVKTKKTVFWFMLQLRNNLDPSLPSGKVKSSEVGINLSPAALA